MVKLTKIYTRTGDSGQTHLAGQHRIAKTSERIVAIGEADELNAWMGMIVSEAEKHSDLGEVIQHCVRIQHQLFNLGAALAILAEDRRSDSPTVTESDSVLLEQEMDRMNEVLPSLRSFILPGGHALSTTIHVARAVCRRFERALFALHAVESIDPVLLQYTNRLSDWLFVLARFVSMKRGAPELLWKQNSD